MARKTTDTADVAKTLPATEMTPDDKAEMTPDDRRRHEIFCVLKRAQGGDESARPEVRKWLEGKGARGFRPLGDEARDSLLKAVSGGSILTEEDFRHQTEMVRRDVAGADPTPLEWLLAERVALCWLYLHYFETVFTQNIKGMRLDTEESHHRRIAGAQRRYLSAIKALAQVRRLGLPAVQVNIADRQLNVANQQVNIGGDHGGGGSGEMQTP